MENNVMQHYLVEIFWSHEDEGYIATVPDLPGCCAWDATEFVAFARNTETCHCSD
jgi:predicted RNase H-like HicB family nuclease